MPRLRRLLRFRQSVCRSAIHWLQKLHHRVIQHSTPGAAVPPDHQIWHHWMYMQLWGESLLQQPIQRSLWLNARTSFLNLLENWINSIKGYGTNKYLMNLFTSFLHCYYTKKPCMIMHIWHHQVTVQLEKKDPDTNHIAYVPSLISNVYNPQTYQANIHVYLLYGCSHRCSIMSKEASLRIVSKWELPFSAPAMKNNKAVWL